MKVYVKNNRIALYLFGKYLLIIYHDNSINNSLRLYRCAFISILIISGLNEI